MALLKESELWIASKAFLKFSFNHYIYIALEKTGNAAFSLEFPSCYVGHQDEVGAPSGRMLMQHKEPAWALFFTWEIADMSFRAAIKAIEQLPRFVVMISGFHSLEQIPLKLPLWFVNQQLPYFLRDTIIANKSVESPGRSEGSGLYFQGLFIFWGVHGILALFLGKKRLGICSTDQPPVFSIYT